MDRTALLFNNLLISFSAIESPESFCDFAASATDIVYDSRFIDAQDTAIFMDDVQMLYRSRIM